MYSSFVVQLSLYCGTAAARVSPPHLSGVGHGRWEGGVTTHNDASVSDVQLQPETVGSHVDGQVSHHEPASLELER